MEQADRTIQTDQGQSLFKQSMLHEFVSHPRA